MKMEYNAQILRGWPYEGALDRAETIKTGVTLVNGDWVTKQVDGTVDKATTSPGGAGYPVITAGLATAGLVIRGNGDSTSGVATNKATVIWGNYIAQIKTALSCSPGQLLTVKANALAVATSGTDSVIGQVLDVITSSATNDTSIIVKIN